MALADNSTGSVIDGPDTHAPDRRRWRIDFSLALFNRSGKFQIGQEIIDQNLAAIDSIWYWRQPATAVPTGLRAKLLGKGEKLERQLRIALGDTRTGRSGAAFRWLHIDPLTVCHRRPAPGDAVLIHDLGTITHPHLFAPGTDRAYDYAFTITQASGAHLVFVSEDSRNQYRRLYGEPASSQVIYPPIAPRLRGPGRERPDGVGEKFLLTVGAIGLRKNQARCIEAFAASGLAAQGFEYVLCGSREPGHEDVVALAERTDGVRLLSFVSDDALRWLYANARGFVLASLLEGFGMPVAEAMEFGLVPLIARDTVLEEVAGNAAIAVDPEDVSEIASAMQALATLDAAELATRKAAMAQRLGRFSHEEFNRAWGELLSKP